MPTAHELRQYYQSSYRNSGSFSEEVKISRLTRGQAQLDFMRETLGEMLRATTFLDLGCGIGAVVYLLEKRGYQAFGVDEDPLAIAWGRKEFTLNLGNSVPSTFGSPGVLILSHTLELFPDIRSALGEWKRARHLFIEVPHANKDVLLSKPPVSHVHFLRPALFVLRWRQRACA